MLVRPIVLIISIAYIQVRCIQQNGTNNHLSNLVLNKTFSLQPQNNVLQNKINQLPKNQPNNVQHSDNMKLAKSLQQAFNLQQTTNLQNANAQPLNLQQSKLLPSITGQHAGNVQQSMVLQQPGNLQQSMNFQQPLNMQQPTTCMYTNNLQPNVNTQQNQNQGNLQTARQALDVAVLPNNQFAPPLAQSPIMGVNPNANPAVITSIPSQANLCNLNSPNDIVSVLSPQNPQVSYTSVPSYVLDISQGINTPSTIVSPAAATLNNQPTVVTLISPPQHNQQAYIVQNPGAQNPTELTNHITVLKSAQPHSALQYPANHNQINFEYPGLVQAPPTSYPETIQSISSILASSLTKQASKSSNVKSLLPLIFNLIKERNNCGCPHHCDCSQKTQSYVGGGEIQEGYSKLSKYGFQPDLSSKYVNDDSEEFDSRESRRNNKKYAKRKNVTPESSEYDYSEELQDD